MDLTGVFAPIVTPFKDDDVDFDALRFNVDRWMTTRLAGVLVLGSNGEAPMLDVDEAYRVAAATRDAVPRDRTLVVGVAGESTRTAVVAIRHAARAGADVVLVRTPSYFRARMTGDAFARFFTAAADASPVPVLPYNVPGLTGINLPVEVVAELSSHPNIPGVKDSSADLTQIADLVATTPRDFRVLVGSAPTMYASLCVGASGAIVAAACVVPELCVRIYESALNGRHEEALALQRKILPLAKSVTSTFGVPGLKAAMDLVGYRGGLPRHPIAPASPRAIDTIRGQLEALQT